MPLRSRLLSPTKTAIIFFSLFAGTTCFAEEKTVSRPGAPSDEVNMLIGSGGGGTEYGGTMPFVKTPFGMTDWVAQTRQNSISTMSYAYEDKSISGFIGTHQPAPWMGDFGYVTLMPGLDSVKTTPDARKMPFAHGNEKTTPYSYSVAMDAGNNRVLKTEMTATSRCALLRVTFPSNATSNFIVEATRPQIQGYVKVDAKAREIVGYNPDRMDSLYGPMRLPNFKGYFVVQFRKAFAGVGTYSGEALAPNQSEFTGKGAGAYVTFPTAENEAVDVRVGTSFISIEQARDNLRREIPNWDFEKVSRDLKTNWDRKLGIGSVEGATDDQRKIFTTAIYHSLVYPREFSEYGRYYSAFDDTIHKGQSYTSFSLWDTFRAQNSTVTLFAPERVGDMVQSLLQNYQEGGWLPKWPNPSYTNIMIATPADSIVAEAINKGFKGFDTELAYKAVYKDAMVPPVDDSKHWYRDREQYTPYEARSGLSYFKKLGFIPSDKTYEAASNMLEDAYDDWCVAQVAKATGRTREYQFFLNRSQAYKTLFNPATGFMQAKNADGNWASPDAGWTEGSK
ncbi:MAG: glycoside hydrolase family 92 protein, partial [Proteobacteria bacterium]